MRRGRCWATNGQTAQRGAVSELPLGTRNPQPQGDQCSAPSTLLCVLLCAAVCSLCSLPLPLLLLPSEPLASLLCGDPPQDSRAEAQRHRERQRRDEGGKGQNDWTHARAAVCPVVRRTCLSLPSSAASGSLRCWLASPAQRPDRRAAEQRTGKGRKANTQRNGRGSFFRAIRVHSQLSTSLLSLLLQ
jgi:hypothetical protein